MKVLTIPIAEIVVGERMREADFNQIEELEKSISELGLIHPITVGVKTEDGYPLVAGLHRLVAYKKLGRTEIEASVIDVPSLQRQLVEIDENLAGPILTSAQRSAFTARRKAIYEELHPETRAGVYKGNRYTGSLVGDAGDGHYRSFTEDTAAKTGVSRRTVERDARRGANIAPDVLQVVEGTYFDQGRRLDALARLPPDEQREIARLVEQGDNDEAVAMLFPEIQNMQRSRRDYRDLVMAWNRANEEAREKFVESKARELEKAVRPKAKPPLSIVRSSDD
jgi:ParB family chromosome partitioning protein